MAKPAHEVVVPDAEVEEMLFCIVKNQFHCFTIFHACQVTESEQVMVSARMGANQ